MFPPSDGMRPPWQNIAAPQEIGNTLFMQRTDCRSLMKHFDRGKYRRLRTEHEAWGIIKDIVLNPREQLETILPDKDGAIRLKHPPAVVLFKPEHGTHAIFADVPAGLVPITPSTTRFTIKTDNNRVSHIKWHQLPMTPAYAFTDYKSQGQTIEYVIIDIGDPPTGRVSPVGVYVMLSRNRGRSTIT